MSSMGISTYYKALRILYTLGRPFITHCTKIITAYLTAMLRLCVLLRFRNCQIRAPTRGGLAILTVLFNSIPMKEAVTATIANEGVRGVIRPSTWSQSSS